MVGTTTIFSGARASRLHRSTSLLWTRA